MRSGHGALFPSHLFQAIMVSGGSCRPTSLDAPGLSPPLPSSASRDRHLPLGSCSNKWKASSPKTPKSFQLLPLLLSSPSPSSPPLSLPPPLILPLLLFLYRSHVLRSPGSYSAEANSSNRPSLSPVFKPLFRCRGIFTLWIHASNIWLVKYYSRHLVV